MFIITAGFSLVNYMNRCFFILKSRCQTAQQLTSEKFIQKTSGALRIAVLRRLLIFYYSTAKTADI